MLPEVHAHPIRCVMEMQAKRTATHNAMLVSDISYGSPDLIQSTCEIEQRKYTQQPGDLEDQRIRKVRVL
jgi:hypothetical protein